MSNDPNIILQFRLPARMRELHAFVQLSGALDSQNDNFCNLLVQDRNFAISTSKFLLDPLADAAALTARSLLHFMGLKLDKKLSVLAAIANYPDPTDLSMKNIGLASLDVNRAISGWDTPPEKCRELFELCIRTGNKVSAHLTLDNAVTVGASIDQLSAAVQLVLDLINREVYAAKSLASISFDGNDGNGRITDLPPDAR